MNLPENAVRLQGANNWVSEEDLQILRAKPLPPGAIAFAKIGEALRHNRLRQVVQPTIVDNNMMGAVPRPDRIDPRFLYYAMSRFDFSEIAQGTAVPYLTVSALEALPIEVPPWEEQRAIAGILGAWDDKIELNRRMNETLEAMARALFKSWFVDFDPVRAKAEGRDPGLPAELADLFPDELRDTALGEAPRGWSVGQVGQAVSLLRDQVNPLDEPEEIFSHFSIPAFDDGQRPRVERGGEIKSLKSVVPSGTILLSKLNPEIDRTWLVDVQPDERSVCSTEFLVLRPSKPFGLGYVYCLLRSPTFRQGIESLVTGTSKSHQRAHAGSVLSLDAIIPPPALRKVFEDAVESSLGRIQISRREVQTLAALRDALLPKLISGELRVSDSEHLFGSGA